MKRFLKILLYVAIIFFALFWGGILILSMASGNSQRMKTEVEKVMGGAFNRTVRISTLNYVSLYPELRLDAEKIMIGSPEEVVRDGREGYFVENIAFAVPFWGVFFNQPEIRVLEMENIFPVVNDPVWIIHTAYFEDESPNKDSKHNFYIQATYDDIPFNISLGAEYGGQGYRFSGTTPIKGIAGDYEFEAVSAPDESIFLLENIMMGPEVSRMRGMVEANGYIWLAEFQIGTSTDMAVSLLSEEEDGKSTNISGDVTFTQFEPQAGEIIYLFWRKLGYVIADMSLSEKKVHVDIAGDSFVSNVKLEPKKKNLSSFIFTGQANRISLETLQSYINQEIIGEEPVNVTFDVKGELSFHPLRTGDVTGTMKLVFADGEEKEISLNETTFVGTQE